MEAGRAGLRMLRGAGWPRPDISSESAMPAYRPCRKTTVRLRVPVGDFLPVVRHDLVRQSWREAVVRAAGWHRTVDAAEIELFASPYAVHKVLLWRTTAWALLDSCHLSSGRPL